MNDEKISQMFQYIEVLNMCWEKIKESVYDENEPEIQSRNFFGDAWNDLIYGPLEDLNEFRNNYKIYNDFEFIKKFVFDFREYNERIKFIMSDSGKMEKGFDLNRPHSAAKNITGIVDICLNKLDNLSR